jgi:predicted ATPase/class 3 adenylate cyclase
VASPPTGTVTFLFTDIEGSTRMWERSPQAMQAALARHDELLTWAIEEHDGYVFKTVGDAFCCAFLTAPDALEAALEAQRLLLKERWGESDPLRVRMALHMGAAEERDGDYFGPPVNRVARLLSAAHGGQVLLSLPTHEMVGDQLPAGVDIRDLGEHRLKDLFRPERVFQLIASGLPSEFPPLRTLDAHRNNLPIQPTPLIGREKEVAEVCKLLLRPEVRLLTLTGAGGTGKTRLALQVAAELTEDFEKGVFFVSLAPISDPELVVPAVAGALGVKETGGQPLLESLKDYLREKRMLLLVDNFEHLLEAAPVVSELLSAAPYLKVLATSRIPLKLYGEHEYLVPPLELPDLKCPPPVERPTQYEAVRLFVERAQAAKADFSFTNDNALAVAEICHRLDGLPLAIELAAARIKLLTPQAMLTRLSDRLSDRLKLLTGGARDLPERQRTLRSTIDWSYGLLEEGEKVLFARLSVFAGGRTLAAMEAICDAEGDLPGGVLDGVSVLVDENLLRQEEGVGGEPRFVMLETIHEYAREKLQESGQTEDLRRRHARYFLAKAEEAEPELMGAEQAEWLKRLELELDNLRLALSWEQEQDEAELGLRLGAALWRFWIMSGRYGEGRKRLEAALAADNEAPLLVRAKATHVAGFLAAGEGALLRSQPHLDEALTLYRRSGSAEGIAMTLATLGLLASYRGDLERAKKLRKESFDRYRKLGDPWQFPGSLRAFAADQYIRLLRGLAVDLEAEGNFTRGVALREEGLALSRKWGDSALVAVNLLGMGNLALDQHNPERAVQHLEEGLALARKVYTGYVPGLLGALGDALLAQGDNERALTVYKESIAVLRKTGQGPSLSGVLEGMASLAAASEDDVRAARLWGAGETALQIVGATLTPADLALYEPYLDAARSRLGEVAWEEALTEGRNMALEEVIEYALEEEPSG